MIRAGVASGALLALASLPIGLGALAFVALVPLLAAADAGAAPRRAALAGWLAGVIFFGVAKGFLLTIRDQAGPAIPIAFGLYVVVVGGVVAVFAVAVCALRRLLGRAVALAAAPLVWIAIEMARALGPLGNPMLKLGYTVSDHLGLIQLAALGGVHAVSLWIAGVNAALVGLRGGGRAARLALAAVVSLPLAYGALSLWRPERAQPVLRVAAVQPHIANARKRVPEFFGENLAALLRLTRAAAAEHPDVIVWPESSFERAVPPWGDPLFGSVARSVDTPVLAGAWTIAPADEGSVVHRNSALYASAEGEVAIVAHKLHPIVVYEKAPLSVLSRALARAGLWSGRFTPGDEIGMVEVRAGEAGAVPVGVIVCVDSLYAEVSRAMRRRGARALLEVSNEAGIGRWSARLHARVARLRAVETRAPLVRVANTGPTTWLDAHGRTVAALDPDRPASGAAAVPLAAEPPPYVRLGEGAALVAGALPPLAVLVAPLALRSRRARR